MDLLNINDKIGEYPQSYYAATANRLEKMPALADDLKCDVCVVGGGYTGLSSALHLAKSGYDVVVLEAQRVGFGASGRNGGQVGSGQRVEQDDLEKMLGKPHARKLWDLGEESKAIVVQLIKEHAIDCAYKRGVMHTELRKSHLQHTIDYVEKIQADYGYDQVELFDRDQVCAALGTKAYHGGSMDWGAGHLHPLNFALGLARACIESGVRIFETTKVGTIERGDPAIVSAQNGKVRAKFVALGANGYLGNLEPQIAKRVMPINNFIIATEPLGATRAKELIRDDVAVADSKFVVNYFRLSEDNRLLFGGGESYGYKFPNDIVAKARDPMLEIYPQLADVKIEYAWGGTLAITMNRMPDFTKLAPNIYSASGYSGHGVAMATLAGKIMAEAISGTAKKFEIMANVPSKNFPGGTAMRLPLLALAMSWFSFRDRV